MKSEIELRLEKVAFNIQKCRKAKGKSQLQVASILNVSQNAYSKLELGKTKITMVSLMAIADYLNTPVLELLT
jgi:transcriptional regulator with XRE-family HTH domain